MKRSTGERERLQNVNQCRWDLHHGRKNKKKQEAKLSEKEGK